VPLVKVKVAVLVLLEEITEAVECRPALKVRDKVGRVKVPSLVNLGVDLVADMVLVVLDHLVRDPIPSKIPERVPSLLVVVMVISMIVFRGETLYQVRKITARTLVSAILIPKM